jgi:hypothetical protein
MNQHQLLCSWSEANLFAGGMYSSEVCSLDAAYCVTSS